MYIMVDRIAHKYKLTPSGSIRCVRWNEVGTLLAAGSDDSTMSVTEFSSKKVLYKSNPLSLQSNYNSNEVLFQ